MVNIESPTIPTVTRKFVPNRTDCKTNFNGVEIFLIVSGASELVVKY